MKIANETKIGLLVTFAIVILILGYNFLKGKDLFTKYNTYYAKYKNIDGLQVSAAVVINGLRVGSVSKINFIGNDLNNIIVEFNVKKEIQIPSKTVAEINSDDFLGSRAIVLNIIKSENNLISGDTLASSIQQSLGARVSKELLPVKDKASQLLGSIDTVLQVVQTIFNAETRSSIQKGVFDMQGTLNNFNASSRTIDTLIKGKIKGLVYNLEGITAVINRDMSSISTNIKSITDSLAQTSLKKAVNDAEIMMQELASITKKINEGDGSMGLLINDKELYNNLNKTTAELAMLLAEIQKNPKKYLGILGWNEKKVARKAKKSREREIKDSIKNATNS